MGLSGENREIKKDHTLWQTLPPSERNLFTVGLLWLLCGLFLTLADSSSARGRQRIGAITPYDAKDEDGHFVQDFKRDCIVNFFNVLDPVPVYIRITHYSRKRYSHHEYMVSGAALVYSTSNTFLYGLQVPLNGARIKVTEHLKQVGFWEKKGATNRPRYAWPEITVSEPLPLYVNLGDGRVPPPDKETVGAFVQLNADDDDNDGITDCDDKFVKYWDDDMLKLAVKHPAGVPVNLDWDKSIIRLYEHPSKKLGGKYSAQVGACHKRSPYKGYDDQMVYVEGITPGSTFVTLTGPGGFSDRLKITVVKIELEDIAAVCKGGTNDIDVTVSPSPLNTSILLKLSTITGSGSATFVDGSRRTNITESTTILVKGVSASSVSDNIKLSAEVAGKEYVEETFSVLTVDLDIDSDNMRALERNRHEDEVEDTEVDPDNPGKLMCVNDTDKDNDRIPDFADGFNFDGKAGNNDDRNESEAFVPLVLELSETIDLSVARLKLTYDASDPAQMIQRGTPAVWTPAPGKLRIWKKDGNEARDKNSVKDETDTGDYISPGTYDDLSNLGFSDTNRTVTFYVEGIDKSAGIADQQIKVEVDPDGNGPAGFVYQDAVRLTVIKADIAMDGDRDDTIDFDDHDDKKYLFWVNDDIDVIARGYEDDADKDIKNCDDNIITCKRDIEDFTRLHLFVDDNIANLSNITYSLKFENVSFGSPSANIFEAVDSSLDYLKYHSAADQQIKKTKLFTVGTTGQNLDSQYIATGNQRSCFILEGKIAGKGDMTFIIKKDGNEIFKKSVELELKPIAEFYDKYVATISSGDDVNAKSTESGRCTYPAENDEYVLFVHGWNMADWAKDRSAETVFKRLWWQRYKGRVGCFQWPTLGILYYDRSEIRAWNAARALRHRIAGLDSLYSGQVRVLAHSMGNVVAGEALRQFSSAVVHTYIAAQAALPAHCYDNTIANYWTDFTTANVYGYYFSGTAPDIPYFSGNSSRAGSLILYFNALDYALGWWEANNEMKPDFNYHCTDGDNNVDSYNTGAGDRFYYDSLLPRDERELVFPNDRYEIFARCVESRSKALGRESSVAGFSRHRNLEDFGYDDQHYSHSREFRSNIVAEKHFWTAVRTDFGLTQ